MSNFGNISDYLGGNHQEFLFVGGEMHEKKMVLPPHTSIYQVPVFDTDKLMFDPHSDPTTMLTYGTQTYHRKSYHYKGPYQFTPERLDVFVYEGCDDGYVTNYLTYYMQSGGQLPYSPYVPPDLSYSDFPTKSKENGLQAELQKLIPGANYAVPGVDCPASNTCGGSIQGVRLISIVIHLNDYHNWSFEDIADWLQDLEDRGLVDLSVVEPEEDV